MATANGSVRDAKPRREMKVLSLGLPRTGTSSMAEALSILGYKNVYHTLNAFEDEHGWQVISSAADATFSTLPTYTGKAFTRQDWDQVFGSCEAVTDTASLFGPHIVKAYPDSKVVLVKRDFDRWFKSIDDLFLSTLWTPRAEIFIRLIQPVLGVTAFSTIRKGALGFFNARNPDDARKNARDVFDRHYREIEQMVPPEKLLYYKLGSGWEPLCTFLDKPVPDVEFPWKNETEELKAKTRELLRAQLLSFGAMILRWTVRTGIVAVIVGAVISKVGRLG